MGYTEKKAKYRAAFLFMLVLLAIEVVVCVTLGAAEISFGESHRIIISKIPILKNLVNIDGIDKSHITIITRLRLPRVIVGGLVGAGLSVTGTAFQGIFKNPLADPYTIGASSGGALGAAIAIILKSKIGFGGFSIVSIFAFVGSLLATLAVYMLGRVGGKVSTTAVILSGVALNALLSSLMSIILLFNKDEMSQIVYWTMGSLSASNYSQVAILLFGVIVGISILYIYSRDLNIMLLGEESAKVLGINTEKLKIIILFTGSFITGICVSVSGIIGFVGIVIPHIIRIIAGPDNRIIIPFASLGGAMFLIAADTVARILIPPVEIPVGILTSAIGGPFFIYILLKNKKKMA